MNGENGNSGQFFNLSFNPLRPFHLSRHECMHSAQVEGGGDQIRSTITSPVIKIFRNCGQEIGLAGQ